MNTKQWLTLSSSVGFRVFRSLQNGTAEAREVPRISVQPNIWRIFRDTGAHREPTRVYLHWWVELSKQLIREITKGLLQSADCIRRESLGGHRLNNS